MILKPIQKYPGWIDNPSTAGHLEEWVDRAISDYLLSKEGSKCDHEDFNQISENVMRSLYALIESQSEIQENKKIYASIPR